MNRAFYANKKSVKKQNTHEEDQAIYNRMITPVTMKITREEQEKLRIMEIKLMRTMLRLI